MRYSCECQNPFWENLTPVTPRKSVDDIFRRSAERNKVASLAAEESITPQHRARVLRDIAAANKAEEADVRARRVASNHEIDPDYDAT
jgi:hypothetical protein